MRPKKVEWYGRMIYLDEEYLVYFSDRKREMTEKQLERYKYIKNVFPAGKPQWVALGEMNPADNPNVTPMSGWELIRLGEAGYTPIFDKYFDYGDYMDEGEDDEYAKRPKPTHRITLLSPDGMEYFLDQALVRGDSDDE